MGRGRSPPIVALQSVRGNVRFGGATHQSDNWSGSRAVGVRLAALNVPLQRLHNGPAYDQVESNPAVRRIAN
jgi:hypothetical protein